MSSKEQLLMNINEAIPIAEKMQALEGRSFSGRKVSQKQSRFGLYSPIFYNGLSVFSLSFWITGRQCQGK